MGHLLRRMSSPREPYLRLHFVLCQSAQPVRSYGQTLEDAVALKEKLLMFDRTLAERSKVFDDQVRLHSHQ